MRNQQQTARVLAWAGLVPFAALAVIAYTGSPEWITELLFGYVVLILAFMSGSLWSGALARDSESPAPLVASNVLVLAALPSLLLPLSWAAAWMAVLFALHGLAEWRWVHSGQPGWYRRLRILLSTSTVVLLVIAALPAFSGG